MKHYATLLLLIATTFLHTHANAFAQGITIKVKDESLENVFKLIQKQSSYSFVYSGDQLKGASKVSLSVVNESIRTVLDMIMKEQPFKYEISEAFVIIKKKQSAQQIAFDADTTAGNPIDLIGKVVDQDGKPVAGATVTVRATGASTATGVDGSFLIKAEERGVLMITNVGYETKLIRITGGNLMVKLNVAAQQMKEVVVSTGYNKVSNERFVGAYSQLDSVSFHRRAGMAILDRLDGTVTGVFFNKKDENGTSIQIRGISTLYSNAKPLIILDNFPYPYDLSTVNPNDVENIVVLKDAAATSIWGSRAGNGVIVITTKKAKFNQPIRVSFQSNISIQEKPNLFKYPTITSSDFIDVEKFLFSKGFYSTTLENTDTWPVVTPVVEILDKIKKGLIDEKEGTEMIDAMRKNDVRNDLNDYVYKKRISHQQYVNLTGGSNFVNYSLSLGFNGSGPVIQNTNGDKQYTINSNVALKLIKNLEILAGISLSQSQSRQTGIPQFRSYPYAQLVDGSGNSAIIAKDFRATYVDTAGGGQLLDWKFRPLDEIKLADSRNMDRLINLNLGLTYRINSWLSTQFLAQYSVNSSDARTLYNKNSYFVRDLINRYTNLDYSDPQMRYPIPRGGILDYGNSKATSYNFRGQISINKTIGINHLITGLIASDISETNASASSNRLYGYNDQVGAYDSYIDYRGQFKQYGTSSFAQVPQRGAFVENSINRFVSLTTNLAYTFKDRYTVYGSARRDGANIFGITSNKKWKPLWSAGGSWQINKESFFSVNWVSNLKLRFSYGYSGNVNNSATGYSTMAYNIDPAQFTGLLYGDVGSPPNPDLRWEEVRVRNIGIDFSLFKNRFEGSVDFFNKESKDLISAIDLPSSSGVLSYFVNSASLKGNGIEINLKATLLKRNISWVTQFGLSHARMKVTKIFLPRLYRAADFISFGINPSVGKLAYGLSSYSWGGLDALTGDPQGYLDGKVSKNYIDIFNDSVGNQVFHGSSIPLYSGFINNTFSWKGLTASFNISYKLNFYYRKPALNYGLLFSAWDGISDYSKRWQKPGDEKVTNVPSMIYPISSDLQGRDDFYQFSEINVLRGDNVRLEDFRIQYTLNVDQIKILKQMSCFVYVNNLNIILWKKDKSGNDPDFTGGIKYIIPTPKTFTIGVNVGL
ncbi:SusC/RagA family TonB-linked outer membrane protein [Pseudobacter ginsenosidimutans]|uniref:TonB-linked SusC/RagA family outer membrane protein n=1 Tax=Pseudobacter ginsenosidimutans TaxID=661488 RepID=A0A4Q7MQS2_9BACT|nr:SusC/RagA family TonB-linked outer membrane protein [Pseudobacter ginsenosidimutans]QEC40308.1 SusC/RagA family TonB-linked outer membrane protein [Pseudobacter ginsenosidimutans]RZS69089.1 TonB-linked SusC/RagA family outer membrane protein [Pseudobacter ginsenosidimutans]